MTTNDRRLGPVADGTITARAAFCGLTADDMAALQTRHPKARIVVRFRTAYADWRETMDAEQFPFGTDRTKNALEYVRDVFLASEDLQ
jgi:hypothetical protein